MDDEVHWFFTFLTILLFSVDMVIRVLALVIVPINRRPQTAMAWLIIIMLSPIIGSFIFAIFGTNKLGKTRRSRQQEVSRIIAEAMPQSKLKIDDDAPNWLKPVARLNRRLGAMPLVGGNNAKILPQYEESLAAMVAAIDAAEHTVHSEFYIMMLDQTSEPYFDALANAASRGVKVRLLVDHIASWRYPHWKKTVKKLNSLGIEWHLMLPINPLKGRWRRPDLRNHRKLLVIDDQFAFTGSQNIIDSSYNKKGNIKRGLHWLDLMVRFDGPVVAGINSLFVADWYAETGELLPNIAGKFSEFDQSEGLLAQVVPSGPAFDYENNLKLFNSLLYNAKESITLVTPYFVPDSSMLNAITTAAHSGIRIDLFVSEVGDQWMPHNAQCSYYEALLEAGVHIHLYNPPIVLHPKLIRIDDDVAVIGSSNMDMRSFTLNLEISVMVYGAEFMAEISKLEEILHQNSRELFLEEWNERPRRVKILNSIARLTATLQ